MPQPQRTDWLHRIGIGVIVLVVISAVVGIFLPRGTATPPKGPALLASIEQRMSDTLFYKTFKERFPDEHARQKELFYLIESNPKLTEATRNSMYYEDNIDVRRRLGDAAYYAPAATIRKLLETAQDETNTVLTEFGPHICAQYSMRGEGALPNKTPKIDKAIDMVRTMNVIAMADGRDSPVDRISATDEDLAAFQKAVLATGVDANEIKALAEGTELNSACPNTLLLFNTALTMPGETGDRVRAYLAWGIVRPK